MTVKHCACALLAVKRILISNSYPEKVCIQNHRTRHNIETYKLILIYFSPFLRYDKSRVHFYLVFNTFVLKHLKTICS